MNVIIAGDFCPQSRVARLIKNGEFPIVLGDVKSVIESADYAIVNLECPVCYGEEGPIDKCGPNLCCSEQSLEAIKWAGFDCVTLANNHFYDYGDVGVNNTLEKCNSIGIDLVGGGKNEREASATLFRQIGNKTIAIINCCEHEFSIASEMHGGSNPLNPVRQYYAIKDAKKKSDYVLVIVHGGHEHYQLPSTRMQETYRFFIDSGADAVVNHHQHCYSGHEIYNGKPIIYGLGNFCFDEGPKSSDLWHDGYMVEITFDKAITFQTYPYTQCKEDATIKLLSDKKCFEESIIQINSIILDPVALRKKQEEYYSKSKISCYSMFDPVNIRYVKKAQHKGWLPFFYSRKYLTTIYNYINCEAHRDKLLYNLKLWNQGNKNGHN